MTEEQNKKRQDILRKVRGLLDTAASFRSSGNFAAADSYEQKADSLMTAYTIESFEIEMAKPAGFREVPSVRQYQYGKIKNSGNYTEDQEVNEQLIWIFHSLASFCRVKVAYLGWDKANVVGYEADLEYLDFLYTTARIHLSGNLEPKPNPTFSEYDNFVILKEAGMKWERIWELLHPGTEFDRSYCQKLLRRYGQECKRQGKLQVKGNPRAYQRSFVIGFKERIQSRLWSMGQERNKEEAGYGLVLANRDEDLAARLYELFPHLKPHPADCDCEACHVCSNPRCNRNNCVARRKPVKASRSAPSLRTDVTAHLNGAAAANKVDFSRGTSVGSKETGEIRP